MTWTSPLKGYENAESLPVEFNQDGKSLKNLQTGIKSSSYDQFPYPIDSSNNGFDFHIYYLQTDSEQAKFAQELHERVRREFPELRIYKLFDRPVGPHPVAMFEVNVFTPHQFGAFYAWLVVNRGPCSVLVHPNTGDDLKDHTELQSWIGTPWPLNSRIFK